MLLVLVTVAAAVLVGRLAGGRLAGLAHLPLRGGRLAVAAAAVQVVGWAGAGLVPALWGVGLILSAGLLLAFTARNLGVPGVALVAAGVVANALAVAANRAMPVSAYAAARAGVDLATLPGPGDPRHVVAGPGTALPWLGDAVPVALPWLPQVASVGDLLLAAGLALLVVSAMRRHRPAQPRSDRSTTRDSDWTTTGSYS